MRMLFIGVLLGLGVNILFAQENIQWGPVVDAQRHSSFKSFLADGDDYYLLKTISSKKQKGIYIEKYNARSLARNSVVFFSNPIQESTQVEFEKLLLRNHHLYWFISSFDRVARKHKLLRYEIDSTLKQIGEPTVVDEYDIASSKSLPGFVLSESVNKKFVLMARAFPYDKYGNEKYMFVLYDSLLREVWKKEIEIPYSSHLLEINEKLIDDYGNVHLLATLSPEKQKGEIFNRNIATDKYLLISFYPAENKMKEFEINLEGKFITSVTAGVNHNGDIAVGGFYSNSNSFALAGTFYLTVSVQTKKVNTLNLKPFEKEFLMEFMSEKNASKGEELNDFYFDHFVLNPDGSAFFVAEEYYKQTYSYFDPNNQLYYDNNTYNFNSIIVVKVNKVGEIEWTRKISKRQISTTGQYDYFSYAMAKGETNLYIMYNDHPGNLKSTAINDDVLVLNQSKYCVPVLITFNENGEPQKQKFYEGSKEKLVFVPTLCRKLNDKTYIVCRQRRDKMQFGLFNLK